MRLLTVEFIIEVKKITRSCSPSQSYQMKMKIPALPLPPFD